MNKKYFLLFFVFFFGLQLQAEQNGVLRPLTEKEISIYKVFTEYYKKGFLTNKTLNALLTKYNVSIKDVYRILYVSKQSLINDVSKRWKNNIVYYGGTSVLCSMGTSSGFMLVLLALPIAGIIIPSSKPTKLPRYQYTFKARILQTIGFGIFGASIGASLYNFYKFYQYNVSINAKKREIEMIDKLMDQLKFNALLN